MKHEVSITLITENDLHFTNHNGHDILWTDMSYSSL